MQHSASVLFLLLALGAPLGAQLRHPLPVPPGVDAFLGQDHLSYVYKGREIVRIERRPAASGTGGKGEALTSGRGSGADLVATGEGAWHCRSTIQRDSEGGMTGCFVEYSPTTEFDPGSTARFTLGTEQNTQSDCILYCSSHPAFADANEPCSPDDVIRHGQIHHQSGQHQTSQCDPL